MLTKEAQAAKTRREIELVEVLSFGTCVLDANENTEEEIRAYLDAYQLMWASTIASAPLDEFYLDSDLDVIAKIRREEAVRMFNSSITRMRSGTYSVFFRSNEIERIRKHENYASIITAVDALAAGVPAEDIIA